VGSGNRPLAVQQGGEFSLAIPDERKSDAAVPADASLQKFAAVHTSVLILFNLERSLTSRPNFKESCTAALAEWRQLGAT